jgi:hypothetical protein
MERIMVVRTIIDGLIERMSADEGKDLVATKRLEFIHSYGAASFARLLAMKRGLKPELGTIAGHLYDIGKIIHNCTDSSNTTIGALEAERVLRKTGRFSEAEISTICSAIRSQNTMGLKENPHEELLKDAILIESYLYNSNCNLDGDQQNRLMALLVELGMA